MDANKRVKLLEVGYVISACGVCKHADLGWADWGTCKLHAYEHGKHTDSTRQLSIHRLGSCGDFEVAGERQPELGLFIEFVRRA